MTAYLDAQVAMVAGLVAETLKAEGPAAPKTLAYATGKNMTFTPTKQGVAVKVLTSPLAAGITVKERLVTATLVPGTSTLANAIAGIAANGQAAALLTLSGDAGTFPIGYAAWADSLALYDDPTPPLVRGVYRSPLPANPPDGRFPCLVVRRLGSVYDGTAPRRKRTCEIEIGYYVGKKTEAEREAAWGCLSTRAKQIDGAIVRQWHPGFESGASLSTLAGIQEIQVEKDSHGAALPDGSTDPEYPCLTMTVRMAYSDDHECDAVALSRVVVKYGLDQQPDANNELIRSYVDP